MPSIESEERSTFQHHKLAKRAGLTAASLILIGAVWSNCSEEEHQAEPVTPVETKKPPAQSRLQDLIVRTAVEIEEKPTVLPIAEIAATVRVVDLAGIPIEGASLKVAIIPHDSQAFYPFRELSKSDKEGKSIFSFTTKDALKGFSASAAEIEENERSKLNGYHQVYDAEAPSDPDRCVLVIRAQAQNRRVNSAIFNLSVSEVLSASGEWIGDVVLTPFPNAPMLNLKVIDKETKLPIPNALVRHAPTSPGSKDWIIGRSDQNGLVRQLLDCKVDGFGQINTDPAYLDSLLSIDGFPLTYDRLGTQFRVSVIHFPEYAPGFCEFAIVPPEEAYQPGDSPEKSHKLDPSTVEVERVVELAPRQYFELEMLDFETQQPINDDYMVAKATYLYHPTGFPPIHKGIDSYTAQSYAVEAGTVRMALDQSDLTGLIITIQPKDNRRDGRRSDYIPHFIPGEALPAPNSKLTLTFSRQPSFTILIKELDTGDAEPPVFIRSSVSLKHKQVTHRIGNTEPIVWEQVTVETPERRKMLSARFPIGAIDFFTGWDSADLLYWELQELRINAADLSQGYEILGPDMKVLAPLNESGISGSFTTPLALFESGRTQVGEQDGTLVFYLRKKQ